MFWWSEVDFSWQVREIGAVCFDVQISWQAQRFVNLEVGEREVSRGRCSASQMCALMLSYVLYLLAHMRSLICVLSCARSRLEKFAYSLHSESY